MALERFSPLPQLLCGELTSLGVAQPAPPPAWTAAATGSPSSSSSSSSRPYSQTMATMGGSPASASSSSSSSRAYSHAMATLGGSPASASSSSSSSPSSADPALQAADPAAPPANSPVATPAATPAATPVTTPATTPAAAASAQAAAQAAQPVAAPPAAGYVTLHPVLGYVVAPPPSNMRVRKALKAAVRVLKRGDRLYLSSYASRDRLRGNELDMPTLRALNGTDKRLVIRPSPLDAQALDDAVYDRSYVDVWPAMLQAQVPGLALDIFQSDNPQTYYLRLLAAMRVVRPSIDQIKQFNEQGLRTGHTAESVAKTTIYYKLGRKSRHPLVFDWLFGAVQLNRLGLHGQIVQMEEMMDGCYELFKRYAENGSVRHAEPLTPEQVALDAELRLLSAADGVVPEGGVVRLAEARAAALAQPATDPIDDLRETIRGYGNCSLAPLDGRGPAGKQLAANLRRARVLISSDAYIAEIEPKLERIADLLDEEFGSTLPRNGPHGRGVATLLWPGAPTKLICELMLNVFQRSQVVCEKGVQRDYGTIVWPGDAWFREYTMLEAHVAQWGTVELATHCRLDRRWRPWHPRNVTFLARKNHDEHFSAGTLDITLDNIDRAGVRRVAQSNATVQIWPLNDLIQSLHVSQLFTMFQHSRLECAKVLEQSWQRLGRLRPHAPLLYLMPGSKPP